MILIIYAHPYPHHSHANKRMLEQARTLEGVEIRSLYQLYPDFNIDIAAEQEALSRADLIVWQHPMQWYSIPPLLKLWIDKVLSHGWAYGHGGTALHGKHLLWAVTTGGGESHFEIGAHPGFDVLSQPLQATAIYCGLNWLPPFAMQAMNERNLMVTQMGRSAFAVLLFQDIAAIPLVAMIPLLATSSASTTMGAFALSALKVAGALVLVVLLGRYVTRPALRFVARSGLREVFSAVALFLVFGFGLLLEEVGLSMAMGAFLAGVLLASSEYRHALESDIEPFKGLLLGLFFIGVGMSIDFGTLLENPLRIVILLLGFLIIKIAMLWLIARPLQVPNKQRRWFAVLLGQGSEFAFVVFGAAQMANVLEPEWAKSLTLAVALSMAATPILLVILNRLEQSSTEEAREADEIDEEQPRVIIAGFGRFGQITGRLLLSSGVKIVVLDHDPDHIETLRKFGMKVFYGDATRMDLLESAGAAKAEVLINAIDDPQTNLQLTEMVKEHFPHLQIIARARDVDHYIRLRQAGVEKPERETFEGALKTGRLALESLGLGPYEARERADVFRRFNIQMVEEMAMVENDTKARAAVYKRTSAMLSEIITEDREHLSLIQRHGWQGTEEGKHTGNMADEPETKPSS